MCFLERERDLHERRAAGIAIDVQPLDQEGERIVLMFEGVEHGGAHAPEQDAKGRVARQVGAEGEHVDEVADHVFEPGSAPAGERAADQEVLLAGVAEELHLERGQQHRVKRGSLARRQGLESAHQLGPSRQGTAPPRREKTAGRGRSIGRSSTEGAPASWRSQYSQSRSPSGPARSSACHRTKSQYCLAGAGSAVGRPAHSAG